MAYQIKGNTWTIGLDNPGENWVVEEPGFMVSGWIANTEKPIDQVCIVRESGEKTSLLLVDRPDVAAQIEGQHITGFSGMASVEDLDKNLKLNLECGIYSVSLGINVDQNFVDRFMIDRRSKRERLLAILVCPSCGSEDLHNNGAQINCRSCQSAYSLEKGVPDMRSEELKRDLGNYSAPVSSNGYDDPAWDLINGEPSGLILDNGAGLRNKYLPNVVNFEISELPTTDVLGVGENLPFRSNVFDAVFSLAVLEHVRDPFKCAQEIERVLKPGGKVYAAVPFLQPFHGYPDHYYNMTSNGLKNLWSDQMKLVESGVPASGTPIWSLSWFLNSYLNGLPAETAESFRNLRVKDLIGSPIDQLEEPYVTELAERSKDELASVTYVIAKKIERE